MLQELCLIIDVQVLEITFDYVNLAGLSSSTLLFHFMKVFSKSFLCWCFFIKSQKVTKPWQSFFYYTTPFLYTCRIILYSLLFWPSHTHDLGKQLPLKRSKFICNSFCGGPSCIVVQKNILDISFEKISFIHSLIHSLIQSLFVLGILT